MNFSNTLPRRTRECRGRGRARSRRTAAALDDRSVTTPSGGEKSIALSTRLVIARRSRKGSPSTPGVGGAGRTSTHAARRAALRAGRDLVGRARSATGSRGPGARRLERGELHHAIDDLLDALRLARDVDEEALAIGLGIGSCSNSAAPRIADSGLFTSCVKVCT